MTAPHRRFSYSLPTLLAVVMACCAVAAAVHRFPFLGSLLIALVVFCVAMPVAILVACSPVLLMAVLMHLDKRRRLAAVGTALEIVIRFILPALLCIGLIVGAIGDYDKHFPSPRDHFTPARAMATIAILCATLAWLAWRFRQFLCRRRSAT